MNFKARIVLNQIFAEFDAINAKYSENIPMLVTMLTITLGNHIAELVCSTAEEKKEFYHDFGEWFAKNTSTSKYKGR